MPSLHTDHLDFCWDDEDIILLISYRGLVCRIISRIEFLRVLRDLIFTVPNVNLMMRRTVVMRRGFYWFYSVIERHNNIISIYSVHSSPGCDGRLISRGPILNIPENMILNLN